jgi:hypothetical protein
MTPINLSRWCGGESLPALLKYMLRHVLCNCWDSHQAFLYRNHPSISHRYTATAIYWYFPGQSVAYSFSIFQHIHYFQSETSGCPSPTGNSTRIANILFRIKLQGIWRHSANPTLRFIQPTSKEAGKSTWKVVPLFVRFFVHGIVNLYSKITGAKKKMTRKRFQGK